MEKKKIEIVEVDNGFVITIFRDGVQTIYDSQEMLIANNVDELIAIVRKNA